VWHGNIEDALRKQNARGHLKTSNDIFWTSTRPPPAPRLTRKKPSMAEASSMTPATMSTPSSSAANTVTGAANGPQHDSASHDHSTNGSQNGLDNSLDSSTKAPKDRSCPFCNQAFTSSSLGRHLDLYIKPKVSILVSCVCSCSPADLDGRRTPSRLMASTTSKRSRSCEAASRDASRETV